MVSPVDISQIVADEIIQMINSEVEPLGGFFGEAFSPPLFQGSYLLVIFGFILSESLVLAGAAVMFYPLQFYLIPKLQRKVNLLSKQRVRLVRSLSERIGETVSGVQEVHAHNTARFELAEDSRRLGESFRRATGFNCGNSSSNSSTTRSITRGRSFPTQLAAFW